MRLGPVMVDVAGVELSPDDIERLQHPQVGGVVLFARTRDKAGHLAKRFAAKEAFSKAIGTGIHAPFRWHSITVGRDPRGKPLIVPSPEMAKHLETLGVTRAHISLTDDHDLAMAFVVLEGRDIR